MIYSVFYVLALVIANLIVATFGPWISIINSFLLIGLDLTLRDKLHDQWNGNPYKIGALIVVAGLVSYIFNTASAMIAIASVVAFCSSMIVDSFVYQRLKNKEWFIKSNSSNVAGAAVDSLVFPTIAFGGLMWEIVLLQFGSKLVGGLIWSYLLRKK